MRYLVFFALLSVAVAKPKPDGSWGGWGGWDAGLSLGHDDWAAPALTVAHAAPVYQAAPVVHSAPIIQAAPVVHAAPVVQAAPVAVKAATSYSSFQRIIHPVAHKVVAAPVVHAPVVQAAPVVHAPVVQAVHSAPLIQSWGHGW